MLERKEKHGISCDHLQLVTGTNAYEKEEVIMHRYFCIAMQDFECVREMTHFLKMTDCPTPNLCPIILDKFNKTIPNRMELNSMRFRTWEKSGRSLR